MRIDSVDTYTSIDQLKAISSWVSSVQDLDKLLQLIIESATNVVQAEAASLLLVDSKTDTLYFKVATGAKGEEVKEFRIKMGQGIAGLVAKTGDPMLIADAQKDKRWMREISDSIDYQTRSMACVPLKINDRTIGVVQVINKNDQSQFSKSDMAVLEEFSSLAALAIGSARSLAQVRQENQELKKELGEKHQIIGTSPILKKTLQDAQKLSRSKTTALILGESGTGKELTARTIHESSDRKEMPFVPMNCNRLAKKTKSEDEIAAQLSGVMTSVGGGTLYLDEISALPDDMRKRIMKLLEETESDSGQRPRMIAGTSKDLDEVIASGAMKESLLDLFNAVFIKLPALRERKEDIPLLINHFLYNDSPATTTRIYGITPSALSILLEYHWPGNLIQLQNVIERAYAMGVENAIGPEDLPEEIRTFGTISRMG